MKCENSSIYYKNKLLEGHSSTINSKGIRSENTFTVYALSKYLGLIKSKLIVTQSYTYFVNFVAINKEIIFRCFWK